MSGVIDTLGLTRSLEGLGDSLPLFLERSTVITLSPLGSPFLDPLPTVCTESRSPTLPRGGEMFLLALESYQDGV